jgi:predicted O-linked N-acetylglucosamine transferase (SPINDLY family)
MSILSEKTFLEKCWQEGIDHILAGQGEVAQATWLMPFLETESSIEEESLTQNMVGYLAQAVEVKLSEGKLHEAYEISNYLISVDPGNVNRFLMVLNISIQANELDLELLTDATFLTAFHQALPASIDEDLLYSFITQATGLVTEQYIDNYVNFLELVADKVIDKPKFVCIIAPNSFSVSKKISIQPLRTRILEICLKHAPPELRFTVLCDLVKSNINTRDYYRAISMAEQCQAAGDKLGRHQRVCGSHQLLTALMEAGEWQRIPAVAQQHQQVIKDFLAHPTDALFDTATIITSSYFLNYLYDEPKLLHSLRNKIGDICTKVINQTPQNINLSKHSVSLPKTKSLRIGFIASTLENHSVGWLSRWFFHYYNRSEFQVFIYNINQHQNQAFNQKFFRDKADVSYYLNNTPAEIADLIRQDEIDILVDLDSLSLSTTYQVMCHKPAPVTVTWLGWDTSGCPEIDYFIADPYVLPADAEDYYRSKIWRLPQTYIAIDGFEIEVPTKRRSDYQIPEDAVVYLCTQKSYKHHPDILRLQMQIIKQVSNSYLMVQLRANPESLIATYQQLTDEVGISMEKLRFIQTDPDEMTHRANLQLADVVLDTFPYNGATTTLETLWMGVPIVTKVGQAFVARNSYAFMKNVGVTEGIAYTDAEYVDWGVKLGLDLSLRQQVTGKMLSSRKNSPLWDARSFTLEMERAYHQMWDIYQSQKN